MNVIRLLRADDAAAYQKLRLEALKNHPEAFAASFEEENEFSLEVFESRLSSENVYTFGAFDGTELFGVVTLVPEQKKKLEHRVNLVAMYVSPEKRGLSFGRRLVEAAISKAQSLVGIKQIHLGVTSSNETAKKLYTSLGFTIYGREINSLKIEDQFFDLELMVLFLKK
ncbi:MULTISPECIES: GNAT family N-acetyltransferase [unclassified Bacillus (in: firmicutes)]|uniref:GNAT family N-acetyltransferase n=1 Tax=unclassified Bacillus (in: firmicutes) TaxID=185979 RepID=UPI0008F38CD2|nr:MULTISPECIES: GNAT family N-acetyltransferase [unclassified Bacillus (in: firmicutes)]SFA86891.1 Ribosomal protein S18 acetylase RimI [Bacillus sp. UNCCL13]SFQ83933.1 Ribosomal protein S18 acetylase RimI [Bacillus sp. cl95]